MSVERHPNINAIGFAAAIFEEFRKHLRGAAKHDLGKAADVLTPLLESFVVDVSTELDMQFDELEEQTRDMK